MATYNPPIPAYPWPIYDSLQFTSLDQNASMAYISLNYLKLSGGTLTGGLNMINATMSGNLVMGSGSNIQSLNTTASTSSTTGALQLAGGAYFGNDCLFNGNLTVATGNSHIYITGSAGGLDLTGNNAVLNVSGVNSHLVLSNTEASTSSSTGSIKCAGGSYFGAQVFIESSLLIGNNSSAKTLTLNTNDVSGSTGILVVNNGSVNMQYQMSSTIGYFGTYSNNQLNLMTNNTSKLTIDTAGIVKVTSTTDSTSISTGCLQLNGGLGIAKRIYCNSSIDCQFLNVNNQGIYLQNGGKTGFISILNTPSTNDLTIQSQTKTSTNNYSVLNLSWDGMLFQRSNTGNVAASATCCLDFGSTNAADCMINLFGGSYFLGANSNSTIIASGGTSGIMLCSGSGSAVSATLAQVTTGSSFQVGSSLRACGFNTTSFSSWSNAGLELHYSTYGQIYAYNRSTLLYRGVYIGNEIYCDGGGHTSIGLGAVASSWRLEVGTNTQNVSSYGYLNSGGSIGFSGSSGNVSFSAYFQGRIAVQGEVDVLSDQRLKSNIRDVTNEEATNFIEKCKPKHYVFDNGHGGEQQYGYIAQDIAKAGLDNLIVCREKKGLYELVDSDGFVSPRDTEFTVTYQKICTILHKYILMQDDQIKKNTNEIEKLKNLLSKSIDQV